MSWRRLQLRLKFLSAVLESARSRKVEGGRRPFGICIWVVAILVAVVSCESGEAVAEDNFQTRVERLPLARKSWTRQLSDDGQKTLEYLYRQSRKSGRILTLPEFLTALSSSEVRMNSLDYSIILQLDYMIQGTGSRRQAAREAVQNAQSSVRNCWLEYDATVKWFDKPPDERKCTFALDGARLYVSAAIGSLTEHSSFDGRLFRTLAKSRTGNLNGSIAERESRISFFNLEWSPFRLAYAMGLTEGAFPPDESLSGYQSELLTRYGFHELPVKFGEFECVCLFGGSVLYYVAPSLNFAFVGYESCPEFDEKLGRLASDQRFERRLCSDFIEPAEGVFFPTHIVDEVTQSGRNRVRREISVTSMTLNEDVPIDFENIFPDGTLVDDRIRNAIYRKGINESVETMLREVTVRRRRRTALLVANVLAILIILGFVVRRWYLAK